MFKNLHAEDSVFQGSSPASARRQRGTTVCLHWLRRVPGLRPSRGARARRIGGTLLFAEPPRPRACGCVDALLCTTGPRQV